MCVEKKVSGAHAAERKKKGLGPVILALAVAAAAIFLLLSARSQLTESRKNGSALLGDKLAMERAARENAAALEAQQTRADGLEADLADARQQLEQLKADLEAAGVRETGLKSDLDIALGDLSDARQTLEITREELQELQVQCSNMLRPTADAIEYQKLYPELYVEAPAFQEAAADKVVYLTFDDGPSAVTDSILETLDQYGIKATFFVVPDGSAESNRRLKAIADAGHTIGIHTASHKYDEIYDSVSAYLEDFELAFRRVEKATGIRCTIFRFPGGSVNGYNRPVYQPIIAEMLRRGFTYYDWNASSDDAAGQTTATGIANQAVKTTTAKRAILLCHDAPAKTATAKALPTIIDKLTAKGYRFDKLDNTVLPVTFTYK